MTRPGSEAADNGGSTCPRGVFAPLPCRLPSSMNRTDRAGDASRDSPSTLSSSILLPLCSPDGTRGCPKKPFFTEFEFLRLPLAPPSLGDAAFTFGDLERDLRLASADVDASGSDAQLPSSSSSSSTTAILECGEAALFTLSLSSAISFSSSFSNRDTSSSMIWGTSLSFST